MNFWRKIHSPGPYKKWWKFCTISKCAKKIIFGKILCSTHQKKCFYKLLRLFLKNWIFDRKSTAADPYKNGENFVLSQNVLRKYFLAKFFVPLIKRSVSTTFKAGLWKIEFLTGKSTAADLTKMVKILYYFKMC